MHQKPNFSASAAFQFALDCAAALTASMPSASSAPSASVAFSSKDQTKQDAAYQTVADAATPPSMPPGWLPPTYDWWCYAGPMGDAAATLPAQPLPLERMLHSATVVEHGRAVLMVV